MKYLLKYVFFSITLAVITVSCKKVEPIELEPCFSKTKDTAYVGDTVTYTNCSIADEVNICFAFLNQIDSYSGVQQEFNSDNQFHKVFEEAGIYAARLTVKMNEPTPMFDFITDTIVILD